MAENEPGQDFLREDARLKSLDERLDAAQRQEELRSGRGRADAARVRSQAARGAAELIGAPVGGAVVGYALDWMFGSFPWVMLAMMFVGFAVGVRNVFRMSSGRPK
ncbi:MAG: AtpZ/AtpI family protein [Sphingomonadaceae bacterium]|nr:AtpZ/AtpI family protein [Sphingomonadaceae bacterium]